MNHTIISLREGAIDLALKISDILDKIEGCEVYAQRAILFSGCVGSYLYEAKNATSRSRFVEYLDKAARSCYKTEYWLELIYRKSKLSEATYKELRSTCAIIRRKLIRVIASADDILC